MLADHDDLLDGPERRRHLRELCGELTTDDQHADVRVVDDVGHLRRGEPPVHGDVDRVQLSAAEEQLEVLGAVLVDERDAVLLADTFGGQSLGDATRSLVETGP